MFSSLKGKFQFVQDGISASFRNLKTKEEKRDTLPSVNYDSGEEMLYKKELQWNELRNLAENNFQKAQNVDEQITQIRMNVSKRWNEVKELNQFILSFPEFINTMRNVNDTLASLQMLTMDVEETLDSIEDLVEKQELQRRQLDERYQFASYLEKKANDVELLKAKLAEEHTLLALNHEKKEEENLKERQQLCDIAFQQDLQLYKESGMLPIIRKEISITPIKLEPRSDTNEKNIKLKEFITIIPKQEPLELEDEVPANGECSSVSKELELEDRSESNESKEQPGKEVFETGSKMPKYQSYSDEEVEEEEEEDVEELEEEEEEYDRSSDIGAVSTNNNGANEAANNSPTPSEQLRPDFLVDDLVELNTLHGNKDSNNSEEEIISEYGSVSPSGSCKSIRSDHIQPNDQDVTKSEKLDVKNDSKPIIRVKESNLLEDENICVSKIEIESEIKSAPIEGRTSPSSNTSSECLLTVRSAKQLNDAMSSNTSLENNGVLSVLNAQQLGVENISSENYQGNEFIPLDSLESGVLCNVCNNRFPDTVVLAQHKATVGHYRCDFSVDCSSIVYATNNDLTAHEEAAHGLQQSIAPIAQLTQQVQGMPVPFQTQNMPGNPHLQQGYLPTQRMLVQQPAPYQGDPNFAPLQQNGLMQQRQQLMPPQQRMGDMSQMNYQQHRAPMKRSMPVLPPNSRSIPPQKRRYEPNERQMPSNMDNRNAASSVINQLSKTVTLMAKQTPSPKKPGETNAVANILANRGITVTATNNNFSQPNRKSTQNNVPMINLNSAVSIIPATNIKQNSSFAVPQGRTNGRSATGNKLATVDLTGPDTPRGRPSQIRSRFTCHICDKPFSTQDQLNQHTATTHRSGRKLLPYRCNQCTAQYPTQQELIQHKNTFHRGSSNNISNGTTDMLIPVVDLKQSGTTSRLTSLGITNYIPLTALGLQNSNGTFGIPIISAGSGRNGNNTLSSLGASNILPLGPLKSIR